MSQIKDTAGAVLRRPTEALRPLAAEAIDGQISGLLLRRRRLVEELTAVDREIRDLRGSTRAGPGRGREGGAPQWFPLRGEQLLAGDFTAPDGLDEQDLHRRLRKIVLDEGRRGRPLDGLELLVAFLPAGGRILSVRTRRPGDADWVRRFEATRPGHGGH